MTLNQDFLDKLERCFEVFPERETVLRWIVEEWYEYVTNKFYNNPTKEDPHLLAMKENGWKPPPEGFWARQVFQYLDRASLFGVGETGSQASDRGRQAALKMATTLIDGLSMMVKSFGLPPAPGYTSGEIYEWNQKGGI